MIQFSRKKKILLIVTGVLVVLLFFLSTFIKIWINNNSEELIGRKVQIQDLHINYAKVSVKVKGFQFFEKDGIKSFASFSELYVNFSPWNLLSNEYALSEIKLDGLNLSVIQSEQGFNFDDLIPKEETPVDSVSKEVDSEAVKFAIHNIQIVNGLIRYQDLLKNNDLKLEDINLELPLIAWNNEKSEMDVDFSLGKEGQVSIDADVDLNKQRYKLNLGIASVDISPFVAYLKDYMHVTKMEGKLNTNIAIDGSMEDFMDVAVKGKTAVNEFAIYDSKGNKFLGTQKTSVEFDSLNIGGSHYQIGQVLLEKPEIYADLFKEQTNFEQIFAPVMTVDSTNVEKDTLVENESELFYSVDSILVSGGFVEFNDHTLNREFIYDIKDIDVQMGQLTAKASRIPVQYSMNLNGGGKFQGNAGFSMLEPFDFTFEGKLRNLALMSFSPYTEFYIARPITQGEFDYDCTLDMKPSKMMNQNSIKISEFDFGDKTKDPNPVKVPVRLALYLLKDKDDNIQFDLPVSGNPNDPDFRLGKIIWKTLMNFLVKTATKPFGLLGNLAGTNPENIEKLPLEYGQGKLDQSEKNTLSKISDILKKKPELKFSFTQETDLKKEAEILCIEQCKKAFDENQLMKMNEDLNVLNQAEKDSNFRNFVVRDSADRFLPIEELCLKRVGDKKNQLVDSLLNVRNESLKVFMRDSLQIPIENFEVKTADLRNISEQQKKAKYRVEVSLK
jgi:hypothetical protein